MISTCQHYVQFATEFTQSDEVINTTIAISFDDLSQVKQYATQLEEMFLFQIQSLIDCIQVLGVSESARLGHLISQLDYNNFYQNRVPHPAFILNPIVPISK